MARLRPFAVYGVVKELREAARDRDSIVVTGASPVADELRSQLGLGAQPGAVREGGLAGAAALVYVLAGSPTEEDRNALKDANRRRVPIVVVAGDTSIDNVPYVLATDIVRVSPGHELPLDDVARALARRLDESGTTVAARAPALRRAVCDQLIATFSRRNGILGVAVFFPGADLPVLTVNQLRLVLRIGLAHGIEVERDRLPEILAVVGTGLGLRALARGVLATVPVAGWAVKGAVAYMGTRAVGEAAVRYFEARTQSRTPAV